MKYFKNANNEVYGYDLTQMQLINQAIARGWDEITGSWPLPPSPPAPQTQFTSLEFLDRFTEQEQIAVVTSTLANAQVKLWYDKMLAASFVDLLDPRTMGGLNALVAAGLLTESRKQEIMTP